MERQTWQIANVFEAQEPQHNLLFQIHFHRALLLDWIEIVFKGHDVDRLHPVPKVEDQAHLLTIIRIDPEQVIVVGRVFHVVVLCQRQIAVCPEYYV